MKSIYLVFGILILFQGGLLWSAVENRADPNFILTIIIILFATVIGMLVFTDAIKDLRMSIKRSSGDVK